MDVYFRIPHNDKDQAKAIGARWSMKYDLWYAPDGRADIEARLAERWPKTTPLLPIDTFPGEDRAFGEAPKLAVDMIPATCWFTNVRSSISQDDWRRIALGVKQRAFRHCELCRGQADKKQAIYLEPHERFDYVEGVQVLKRLVCVCTRCHNAIHFGRAQATGKYEEARAHLARVNGWDPSTTERHIRTAFTLWATRSRQEWSLDLSILEATGVEIQLPSPTQRLIEGVDLSALLRP